MKIGAIVQARTTSTRLPRKILKELPYRSNITVLEQVIRRLKRSKFIDIIVIATTEDKEDLPITEIATKEKVIYYRGSKNNVLSRYYFSARENDIDIIVRITSDCPVIDPLVVDLVIERFLNTKVDYAANILKRTFPHGMDTEVFTFKTLEKAYEKAKKDYEREHVTPYIKNHPELFKLLSVEAPFKYYGPDIRVTLDTEEDYALLCAIYDYLYKDDSFFGIEELLKLFKEKPWLMLINKKVRQKKIFSSFEEELKEAIKILELQELYRIKKYLEENYGYLLYTESN